MRDVPVVVAPVSAGLALLAVALAAIEPTGRSVPTAALAPVVLTWAALAIPVARRAPSPTVGALMALVAFNLGLTIAKETGWDVLAAHPAEWDTYSWTAAVFNESAWFLAVSIMLLVLYFPDGRLPSRRLRVVPAALLTAAFVHEVWGATADNPLRPPLDGFEHPFPDAAWWIGIPGIVAFVVLLGGILLCVAAMVFRFRRADSKLRQQIKWLALTGFGVPAFFIVCMIEVYGFGGPSYASIAIGIAAIVGMPMAVSIAMLRHDLYDIDRAISTAVTYTLATGVLFVVFVVTAITAGVLVGGSSALAAAAATGISALAMAPLRRAVQRRVDRRFYPLRDAAREAIRTLEQRTHTGEARPERLEAELRTALRDPALRVAYHLPGRTGFVDGLGMTVEAADAVPITMDGTTIGAIIPGAAAVSPSLLREVAHEAATLVEVVRLRAELTAAVREVEASRSRLVQVGDEERRKLERDLHDGAQQRLVALGMSLRLAQRHLADRAIDMHALIDQTVAELGTAVAELRQIAHGLRPSRLDDGLPNALQALSRGFPVPIQLEVAPVRIPDHVATTIYFVASEALANAVKYASASQIDVRVAECTEGVEVSVSDDGAGGAVIRHGSGLAGLRDRVAALGGSFTIDTAAGRGTTVHAVLPCAS